MTDLAEAIVAEPGRPLAEQVEPVDQTEAQLPRATEPVEAVAVPKPQVDLPNADSPEKRPEEPAKTASEDIKAPVELDTPTIEPTADEYQPPRRPFSPSGRPLKCYIGNLSRECKMFHLREKFSPYGTITNVELKPNIGCGFVEFSTSDACAAACSSLDGTDLFDQVIRVEAQRERSNFKKNFGPGSDGCFNCGAKDHWSKHCPNADRGASGGFRGRPRFDNRYSSRPPPRHYEDRRGPPVRASYGVPREQYIPPARPQYQAPPPRESYPPRGPPVRNPYPERSYEEYPPKRVAYTRPEPEREPYTRRDRYDNDPYAAPAPPPISTDRPSYKSDRYADPYANDPYAAPEDRNTYSSRAPPARSYANDPYAPPLNPPRARYIDHYQDKLTYSSSPGYNQDPYYTKAPYGNSSNRTRSRSPYEYV